MDTYARPFRVASALAVTLAFGLILPGAVQAQDFTACYVPDVGAVYMIQKSGLPSSCLDGSHVEFSWSKGGGSGTTDHGKLDGLSDDDHPQYLLANGVREATDGFAVTGQVGTGEIPAEGSGTRLMWYPGKAAFRAGRVHQIGRPWNDSKIGKFSAAFGDDTEASGDGSMAMGAGTEASGIQSTAMGSGTIAAGDVSMAMGASTVASGTGTMAMGFGTKAKGKYSTAIGEQVTASGHASVALGYEVSAKHAGTFVWGDDTGSNFASTDQNQFLIRAVGGMGVGTANPHTQFEVERKVSGVARKANHVAFADNQAGSSADVLALEMEKSTPGSGNNYITFFGAGSAVGAIQGNGSGGVELKSGGGDFAEQLPRREGSEPIEAGEVVGVHGGEVSNETAGADRVMVVTDRAIVVGNAPGEENRADYEKVAFLGQVPVKTRGPVSEGDLLVASGREDGTAVAVTPHAYDPTTDAPVIGRAWESASGEGVHEVTAAVGLNSGTEALGRRVEQQADAIEDLRSENANLRKRVRRLEATVKRLVKAESAQEGTDGGSR